MLRCDYSMATTIFSRPKKACAAGIGAKFAMRKVPVRASGLRVIVLRKSSQGTTQRAPPENWLTR